jgi:hypothetical protein
VAQKQQQFDDMIDQHRREIADRDHVMTVTADNFERQLYAMQTRHDHRLAQAQFQIDQYSIEHNFLLAREHSLQSELCHVRMQLEGSVADADAKLQQQQQQHADAISSFVTHKRELEEYVWPPAALLQY